jgi:hypothetical protein
MSVSVIGFDHKSGEVTLVSDAKEYASQLSELRGFGINDVAVRHAESNGRVVTGIIETGPSTIQYFDKKAGTKITGNINSEKYRDHPERIQPRRVVKLSLTGSAASSFQGLKK